jgi:hypothetical protein
MPLLRPGARRLDLHFYVAHPSRQRKEGRRAAFSTTPTVEAIGSADDGIGIDPKVLNEGARAGHWGLPGVRERAKLAGGQLDFWSEVGAGTEVQVTVPASVAYA